ncbi:MAG: aminotransferase class V-fold PLP-dependent enzyme [Dehalococcoidia bacterium]
MTALDELTRDPYAFLGVRRFINATCHHTMYGGSLMPQVSLDAMRAAATSHVDMMELQRAAGRIISRYTHADDGYIVSGCAAAMLVGTAAILTGKDPAKMQQLPDTTDMKSLCVAKRFRRLTNDSGVEYSDHSYAIAVQTAGVKFVEVGNEKIATREEYAAAFSDDVALVYWIGYGPPGDISIEDVIDIAHARGVPVLIDASNSLPPAENLHRFIDLGADLVAFSGGKGLQGPQGAGILAGRADLIEAVAMQSAPEHGIGRVCKVSKEELVGQVTSLIWWAEQDEEDRMTEHHRRTAMLADLLRDLPSAEIEIVFPDANQRPYPTVHVRCLPASGMDARALLDALHSGEPAIAAMSHSDPAVVRLDVRLCEDWEINTIGARLNEIFGNSQA